MRPPAAARLPQPRPLASGVHSVPAELLADPTPRDQFTSAIASRGLEISALSCHGNPLHPDAARATADDAVYRDTVKLARAWTRVSAPPASGGGAAGVDRGAVGH